MVGQGSRGGEGREDFKHSYSILIMPNIHIHTHTRVYYMLHTFLSILHV